MFKEQKKTFEVERKNFTEAAIRLGREVGSHDGWLLFHLPSWSQPSMLVVVIMENLQHCFLGTHRSVLSMVSPLPIKQNKEIPLD